MSKIKDIMEKMQREGSAYSDLRLLVAKRVWLVVATLFYITTLFTVGGFYFGPFSIAKLSELRFHLYSILVIATGWTLFSIGEYIVSVYAPTRKWLLIIPILLSLSLVVVALIVHLGLI